MSAVTQNQIIEALSGVNDPDAGNNIVDLNMITGLNVNDNGEVVFMIEVDPVRGPKLEPLRQEAEKVVSNLPGVSKVTAVLTAQKPVQNNQPHADNKGPIILPSVKHIIAVSSGKGGVGKSTVAANLVVSLSNSGQKIGLLDADIYGPSQPRMMGLQGQKPGGEDGRIEPLKSHGVSVMSIGFMIDERAPLVWRGPMVQSALVQLVRDVDWGELDILVIDMPPGTGDAQLTISQKVPLSGAVVVSTPQDIALLDARKGIEMFQKVGVPILGIVENMSTYICPNCGHEDHIFSHGGAKAEAESLGVRFLGEVPLNRDIRLQADAGNPAVGKHSKVFDGIAKQIIEQLSAAKSET